MFFICLPTILLTACVPIIEESRSTFALGTVCNIFLFENGKNDLYTTLFHRLSAIEAVMSANEISGVSELSQVNQNAGIRPVAVSGELITVLQRALFFANLTDGAFNPAVGPLVKLWNIGAENARLPGESEIAAALSLIDYCGIEVDEANQTVFLKYEGMSLDLGGIAKGYAADELVNILRAAGIRRAVIDLGGNIYAHGSKTPKQKWRIGIQNPFSPRGEYLAVEESADETLVTSGVYERFFEENGVRYHHILDPKTGYPADSGLLSVTVIAESSLDADALSTSLFVLGYEQGCGLLSRFPGIEAVFVFRDATVKRYPAPAEPLNTGVRR
ncbi:MAG: FAD:protein FMN transferase [Spirochaetaceae bacterium]|nr:FAD:protein FMN transferase [Spirochaetaceae bacterium]